MKKLSFIKLGLALAFGFFWISLTSFSQESKLTRQEKKEARKAAMVSNFDTLNKMLETKSLVLEADYLQSKYGDVVPVSSDLNFISIVSGNGVLQTGSAWRQGYNGVGGVTAEGIVGSWDVTKNLKKLSYLLKFSMMTNIGIYDITMNISADTRATAVITGLAPGKIIYQGYIKSPNNSRVYKGRSAY